MIHSLSARVFQEIVNQIRQGLKASALSLVPVILFLGLNAQQLLADWTIQKEAQRLTHLAAGADERSQNPAPLRDEFNGTLSPGFWDLTFINGGGQVSHEQAWHSAALTVDDGLVLRHFADPDFEHENDNLMSKPAAEQYNNITLIGGSGFHPTPSHDVVLQFSAQVSQGFYGTAGVIFQPVGTLQEDGLFVKPFDMFGISVAGEESSIQGVNGALCYLALNWMPVEVHDLSVEPEDWHAYEVRLRWFSRTEWTGSVKVDGQELCEISMPAFGPVEVQVWSDNALVRHRPQRWWELDSTLQLKFQDGGEKEFHLQSIQIFAEAR